MDKQTPTKLAVELAEMTSPEEVDAHISHLIAYLTGPVPALEMVKRQRELLALATESIKALLIVGPGACQCKGCKDGRKFLAAVKELDEDVKDERDT